MNTDAGMAGEAISVMNVYHSLAASTEHARFHGSATVSKAGVDSSAIKVCYSTHQRYVFLLSSFGQPLYASSHLQCL